MGDPWYPERSQALSTTLVNGKPMATKYTFNDSFSTTSLSKRLAATPDVHFISTVEKNGNESTALFQSSGERHGVREQHIENNLHAVHPPITSNPSGAPLAAIAASLSDTKHEGICYSMQGGTTQRHEPATDAEACNLLRAQTPGPFIDRHEGEGASIATGGNADGEVHSVSDLKNSSYGPGSSVILNMHTNSTADVTAWASSNTTSRPMVSSEATGAETSRGAPSTSMKKPQYPRTSKALSNVPKFLGYLPVNFRVTKVARFSDVEPKELDPDGTKFWWVAESEEPVVDLADFKSRIRDYLPWIFDENVDLDKFDALQSLETYNLKARIKRRYRDPAMENRTPVRLCLRLDGELDAATAMEPPHIPEDILQELPSFASDSGDAKVCYLDLNHLKKATHDLTDCAVRMFDCVEALMQKGKDRSLIGSHPNYKQGRIRRKLSELRWKLSDLFFTFPKQSFLYNKKASAFPETIGSPIFYQIKKVESTANSADQFISKSKQDFPALAAALPDERMEEGSSASDIESGNEAALPLYSKGDQASTSESLDIFKRPLDNFSLANEELEVAGIIQGKLNGIAIAHEEDLEISSDMDNEDAVKLVRATRRRRLECERRIRNTRIATLEKFQEAQQLSKEQLKDLQRLRYQREVHWMQILGQKRKIQKLKKYESFDSKKQSVDTAFPIPHLTDHLNTKFSTEPASTIHLTSGSTHATFSTASSPPPLSSELHLRRATQSEGRESFSAASPFEALRNVRHKQTSASAAPVTSTAASSVTNGNVVNFALPGNLYANMSTSGPNMQWRSDLRGSSTYLEHPATVEGRSWL